MAVLKTLLDNCSHAQFKGDIVSVLEDLLAEKEAVIENEDREMAIEDGEDPETLAIIFGDDYDIISDMVADLIERGRLDTDSPVMKKEEFADFILETYKDVYDKAEFKDGGRIKDEDIALLKQSVIDTLNIWNVGV